MPHMMRKQYFIKGPIQSRYLILTVFSMIVPTLLVSGCLYYLIATLMAHELALPESIYGHLIPVLKKINVYLAIGLPIIFAIIFFYAVIISHRLAGPIFRLEKDLDRIIAGDHSVRIKFRTKDRLDNIADKLNQVLNRLPKT
ncbi:MAG: hypothetical protein A2Z91_04735 [Deltaproteobacteria bacterium GWA2_38_16]|nr:MAG: hypothetical protein A2Z91_04735 [Deltaproteobacteria bacterium GWA2_38_16]OGQ01691.1 MAG: hypothetical protein A3D19_07445 [Deltaproteobacteria bacterium RIFCSPHIGHO2_02_FULL_38_15]OGQ34171.1 MAG: hypothetical protein A3A72_00335 [Deltaproteobacteria bacterium RIFCSPLOWO2_01_FULL_38_9]HBQ21787.1 hypothetical protein [Deltaproteobacteria bacterium]